MLQGTCRWVKWQSALMCLVWLWKIWLLAMCIALVLSELTGVGLKIGTPSSRRCQCQITSLLAEDIDLYLVSADDLETMVCFLHFKEIVRSQMMQSSMSRIPKQHAELCYSARRHTNTVAAQNRGRISWCSQWRDWFSWLWQVMGWLTHSKGLFFKELKPNWGN